MNFFIIIFISVFLFLLFYYFNFYRYFQIKYNSNLSDYINQYAKVKKIKCDSKIIVSISCRPNNVHCLKPLLISLLNQSVKIDQIALNIPYKTNDGEKYELDKEFEQIVNIYRIGNDYQNENNIIPTLLREGEYGTIVIALNENIVYGETFLESLLNQSFENNNCAIIFNEGILVKPEFFSKNILYQDSLSNIRKYIKSSILHFEYFENYNIVNNIFFK